MAATGMGLSAITHLGALFGHFPLGRRLWPLHVGGILMGFPTLRVARTSTSTESLRDRRRGALDGCPQGVKVLMGTALAYAGLNFLLFIAHSQGPHPSEEVIMRGFSGHWIALYAVEFAVLLAGVKRNRSAKGT
jgi:hypothetical protein